MSFLSQHKGLVANKLRITGPASYHSQTEREDWTGFCLINKPVAGTLRGKEGNGKLQWLGETD